MSCDERMERARIDVTRHHQQPRGKTLGLVYPSSVSLPSFTTNSKPTHLPTSLLLFHPTPQCGLIWLRFFHTTSTTLSLFPSFPRWI